MIHNSVMKKFHKINECPDQNSKIFFHICDGILIRFYINPFTSLNFRTHRLMLDTSASYEICFRIQEYFNEFVETHSKSIFISFKYDITK